MLVSQAFPSKYLKADDLQGRKVRVTIEEVKYMDVGTEDKPDHKLVVFFVGKDKGLVLNKTNAGTLVGAYGDETDHWGGKDLVLYAATVNFRGQVTKGLRVEIPVPETEPEDEPGF